MQIKVLAFGIARDILGSTEVAYDIDQATSVGMLKERLMKEHPEFEKLRHLALAVNSEYVQDDLVIAANDEVVIIPPVSGG